MIVKSLLLLLWSFTVDAAITPDLGSLEVCAGFNINFNWTYDNIADLFLATWSKGVTQVVSKSGTSAAIIQPGFDNKFEYISNGAIKLLDAVLADDGSYTFSVTYIGASGIPPDDNTASLTVLDPPDAPTGNCTSGTSKECTCRTTGLGTPPATLQINIDGVLKTTATATATLDKTVDCCVVGDSVKCMPENTDGDTEYCVNVPETPVPPGPICKKIVCFIPLILNVVFAIIFVGIHSYLIWKKHDWAIKEITKNDFGKKACLPAGCVCCILVLTQFLIFYLADDVKGCAFPVHLILPIILMVLKDVAAVGIIGGFVHHRGTKTSGKAVKQEDGNVPLEQANGNSKTVGKIDRL